MVCGFKYFSAHFHSESFHSKDQQGCASASMREMRLQIKSIPFNNVSFYLYTLLTKPGIYTASLKCMWYIYESQTWLKYISVSEMKMVKLEIFLIAALSWLPHVFLYLPALGDGL